MGNNEVYGFLRERGKEYGERSWIRTNTVMKVLYPFSKPIGRLSPFTFAWIQMLNKLVRAMEDPFNRDHWKDIVGYATLVLEELDVISSK